MRYGTPMDAASRTDPPQQLGRPEHGIRVVAFDVDGTLVEHENGLVVWQILNRLFIGNAELNAERFRAFQVGDITYEEWVALDIEGWRDGGATRQAIESAISSELRLVPGAREVTAELKRRGFRLIVVSGTLDIVIDTLFPEHPFDRIFSNRIRFDDDGAIGGWTATPFDMAGKAEALRILSRASDIPTESFAFVGDHVNDLDALALAGCPIAYDPKDEAVRRSAKHVLPAGQLSRLLDLLPAPAGAKGRDS